LTLGFLETEYLTKVIRKRMVKAFIEKAGGNKHCALPLLEVAKKSLILPI
jgi:hypothetical protein